MKAILLCLLAISTSAAACPRQVELRGADFLGAERFPSEREIETNFRQVFHAPGEPGLILFAPDDLRVANAFVRLLERNYHGGAVTLTATGGTCSGQLEGHPFTIDSDGGVEFILRDDHQLWSERATLGGRQVVLTLDFPSNCSNCNHEAELFDFRRVIAR